MNKKVIIGNFKMNLLPNEVVLYIENLKKDIKSNNEIVLCVPYVDIPYASNIVNDTNIYVGAQNMYSKEEGPYTGEISVKMLKSVSIFFSFLSIYVFANTRLPSIILAATRISRFNTNNSMAFFLTKLLFTGNIP